MFYSYFFIDIFGFGVLGGGIGVGLVGCQLGVVGCGGHKSLRGGGGVH